MMYYTHLAFGLLVGALTYQFFPINKFLFFFIVLFGALLPDIDNPDSKINSKLKVTKILGYLFKHRGVFHSVFFALLLPGLVWYLIGKFYGLALFVGYMSHLVIDGFTLAGINFLNPIVTLRLHGFVKTGGLLEKCVFVLLLTCVWIVIL